MHALYHPTLNGGEASDWLRPIPCQQEGNKLPKGAYQSGNGYSTGVHLPEHLGCDPSSRREASHVSSQGKEAVFVTHDIYKKDIRKDGAFMGIWQIFQVANVVKQPIRSVFPNIGNVVKDLNRTVYCIDNANNIKPAINIMWTPMQVKNSRPCQLRATTASGKK